jgi:hypothetical protein
MNNNNTKIRLKDALLGAVPNDKVNDQMSKEGMKIRKALVILMGKLSEKFVVDENRSMMKRALESLDDELRTCDCERCQKTRKAIKEIDECLGLGIDLPTFDTRLSPILDLAETIGSEIRNNSKEIKGIVDDFLALISKVNRLPDPLRNGIGKWEISGSIIKIVGERNLLELMRLAPLSVYENECGSMLNCLLTELDRKRFEELDRAKWDIEDAKRK